MQNCRSCYKKIYATVFLAFFGIAMLGGCSGNAEFSPYFERVSTIAGLNREIFEPFGIAVNDKEIYVSDGQTGTIFKIDRTGSISIFTSGLDTPSALAFTDEGNLIVADSGSHTIISIDQKGEKQIIAGTNNEPGDVDGSALQAKFNAPVGLAVKDARIYVADTYNDKIRIIEDGNVRTVAGSTKGYAEGNGALAKFDTPLGLAILNDDLLVADSENRRIRSIDVNGNVTTLVGGGLRNDGLLSQAGLSFPTAVHVAPGGVIFIADGNSIRVIGRRNIPFLETISENRRGLVDGHPHRSKFNRPSGLAINYNGDLLIADSDNGLIRALTDRSDAAIVSKSQIDGLRYSAKEFRGMSPGRWPYSPPDRTREIAGTLGEIRGELIDADSQVWFHNGLDIPGAYGETARFIRDEKVLDPAATANFNTSRELLRMPTVGYIHIKLGRDSNERPFNDSRFHFFENNGKQAGVRIPRGTKFKTGEAIGTLNSLNHVHLIAGRPAAEMNALDALVLPGVSDGISPIVEDVLLFDENWNEIKTINTNGDKLIEARTRIVVKAYDRKDGNAERRRLAPYKIGYSLKKTDSIDVPEDHWNLSFERMPAEEAVKFVYAPGSRSGATGVTIFNFIATNFVFADEYKEQFLDPAKLESGNYVLTAMAQDFFGNIGTKQINIEVIK